jgi:hypothetical protein
MKKIFFTILSTVLLATACTEDKGNYDYHEITDVTISGIEQNYQVMMNVGVLEINPTITLSDGGNPDDGRYQYLWISAKLLGRVDTIGHERILRWQATLPISEYDLQLRVIDKETGNLWRYKTKFNVVTFHTRGFLLIGENSAGKVQVQMLAMLAGQDTVLYDNLLEYSGLPDLTGPKEIFHTGNSSGTATKRIWLITESGSYWIDNITLASSPENTLNTFMATPHPGLQLLDMAPRINQANGNNGSSGQRFFTASDGNLYYNYISFLGAIYEFPVNCLASDLNTYFPASPYLFHSLNGLSGVVWYDTQNERFMRYGGSLANNSEIMVDNSSDPFPWNQGTNGRVLVYGENTRDNEASSSNGTSFAIMRVAGQDATFIYKFYANGTPKKLNSFEVSPAAQAAGFAAADRYAFSSLRPIVFFVKDGEIWCYDYNPGSENVYQINLGTNDPVTMLKFDREVEPTSDFLYVATYNASSGGVLTKYSINTIGQAKLTPVSGSRWTGLVKIANMSWRGSE